ncbi:MAG: hypothetical protein WAN46_10410 [Gammaproteobacteria bacterium]
MTANAEHFRDELLGCSHLVGGQAAALLGAPSQHIHFQSLSGAGVVHDEQATRALAAEIYGKSDCSLVTFYGHLYRPAFI